MKFKVGDKVRIKDSEYKTIWEITDISTDREGNEFVAEMVDTGDEESYSDVAWYEEELEYAEELELANKTVTVTLDDVKTFAEWQTDIQTVFGVSLISLDYDGIAVTNPWLDETGRFELDNKQAIRNYGVESYTKFIKEAIEALKFAKENGYKL